MHKPSPTIDQLEDGTAARLTFNLSPLIKERLAALGLHNVLHAHPKRVRHVSIRRIEAGVRRGGRGCAADEGEGNPGSNVGTHGVASGEGGMLKFGCVGVGDRCVDALM